SSRERGNGVEPSRAARDRTANGLGWKAAADRGSGGAGDRHVGDAGARGGAPGDGANRGRGVSGRPGESIGHGAHAWVFHAGALGDFVHIWPLLRALRRGGAEVTVVTHASKARLAERELGVRGVDIERREWSELWVEPGGEGAPTALPRPVGVTVVI